ncbi:MAG: ParB N-terminal domain-containing protein, partial [Firmicutes bacterium]|nr:ParB N-terminal domain-containing protein [Bacillota bacterium]
MTKTVKLADIIITDRIRKDFGDIDELARDIEENGLMNPPVVTEDMRLIAGERRCRALKKLGRTETEVRVMPVADALLAFRMEISENENRKD